MSGDSRRASGSGSTYYQQQPAQAPLIRQPVGFSSNWNSSSAFDASSSAPPRAYPPPAPAPAVATVEDASKKKHSSKDKGKEKSKDKSRSKDKSKSKHQPQQNVTSAPQHSERYPNGPPPPVTPSFRIQNYSNEPSRPGPTYMPTHGHYLPNFAVESPPPENQAPRDAYYRHDYERERRSAPSRAHRDTHYRAPPEAYPPPPTEYPPTHQEYRGPPPREYPPHPPSPRRPSRESAHYDRDDYYRPQSPPPPPPPHRSHHSSDHSYAHPNEYSQPQSRPPPPQHYPPQPLPSPRYPSPQPLPPPQSQPSPQPYPPGEHTEYPNLPPPSHTGESVPPTPKKTKKLRMLTLLMEDMRNGESQLAEVKVNLKQFNNDDSLWADAQEIITALQSGPSRIDGPAKVSTMRGKYKQIFLRVSAAGELDCKPTNIKVNPDRTMDIIIEDLPPHVSSQYPHSTPASGMLTPVTPSPAMATAIAAPRPVLPAPPDRFSPSRYDTDMSNGPGPDQTRPSRSSKKRRRSDASISQPAYRQDGSAYHSPSYTQPAQSPIPVEASPRGSTAQHVSPQRGTSGSGGSSTSSSSSSESGSRLPSPHPTPAPTDTISQAPSPPRGPSSAHSTPLVQAHPNLPPPPPPQSFVTQTPPPMGAQRTFSYSAERDNVAPQPDAQPSPTKKAKRTHDRTASQPSQATWNVPRPAVGFGTPQPSASGSSFAPPASGSGNSPAPATFNIPVAPSGTQHETQSRPSTSHTRAQSHHTRSQSAAQASAAPSPALPAGPSQAEIDTAVSNHLRTIFKADVAWSEYVESRKKLLPVSQQIIQLRYVQSKFDQWCGRPVPDHINPGAGTIITKVQVAKAFFNMPITTADEATEVLTLNKLYGPEGERTEDSRAVAMYDEPAAIATKMQMGRYLTLLRQVHNEWCNSHPDQASEIIDVR